MKPRIYVAGPMTGLPEFNFPAFHAAAKAWRAQGWEVVNPAEEFDGATNLPYRAYVERDVERLRTVDAIAMLDGWDGPNARGSCWEREVARKLLHLPIFDADDPLPAAEWEPETPLQEAQRLVHGDRQASYGHPIEDFTRTGRMWGAILGTDDVPPEKVALCMIAVKMSRECNKAKRDNWVDMAGYAETGFMVRERQGKVGK